MGSDKYSARLNLIYFGHGVRYSAQNDAFFQAKGKASMA